MKGLSAHLLLVGYGLNAVASTTAERSSLSLLPPTTAASLSAAPELVSASRAPLKAAASNANDRPSLPGRRVTLVGLTGEAGMTAAAAKLAEALSSSVPQVMKSFDRDGSGEISRSEFLEKLEAMRVFASVRPDETG